MKNIIEIKKDISSDGFSEVFNGIYLHSKENIISDKKEWDDEDKFKNEDLSKYDFYIIAAESEPKGFDTIEEAVQFVMNL